MYPIDKSLRKEFPLLIGHLEGQSRSRPNRKRGIQISASCPECMNNVMHYRFFWGEQCAARAEIVYYGNRPLMKKATLFIDSGAFPQLDGQDVVELSYNTKQNRRIDAYPQIGFP